MNYIDYANAVKIARGKFGPQATLVCKLSAETFEKIKLGGYGMRRYEKQPGDSTPQVPYGEGDVIFKIVDRPGISFGVLDTEVLPADI